MKNPKAPPKNLRQITPRCCGNCAYGRWDSNPPAGIDCLRPDGPVFDFGDGMYWFTVCDGWKDPAPNGPPHVSLDGEQ